MPKAQISSSSSSSSDDEAGATEPLNETNLKTTKYECPEDFVCFCHVPCSSTLTDHLMTGEKELWLIKAPASFNSECLSGVQVPLSGLQTLTVPAAAETGEGPQLFSVLASNRCSSELRLITRDRPSSDSAALAPMFSGLLNVCESYADCGVNRVPHVIPAAPAPSVPLGLKQRFLPFGSKTPTLTYIAESEVDGAAFGPSSTTLRPLVFKTFVEEASQDRQEDDGEEDGRKKKRKKKKEKRIKSEEMQEVLRVKQEPLDAFEEQTEIPFQEKRKKKRKKKDWEREEVEEGLEPSVRVKVEAVSVKSEPLDFFYGDAAEVSGKKKKKKRSKPDGGTSV
uniref:CD3e molecule, epsilon associated protein n=2 Tax=Iconisemion striatum TaxID=60296 RepID=A0A1A7YYV4_9TELE